MPTHGRGLAVPTEQTTQGPRAWAEHQPTRPAGGSTPRHLRWVLASARLQHQQQMQALTFRPCIPVADVIDPSRHPCYLTMNLALSSLSWQHLELLPNGIVEMNLFAPPELETHQLHKQIPVVLGRAFSPPGALVFSSVKWGDSYHGGLWRGLRGRIAEPACGTRQGRGGR